MSFRRIAVIMAGGSGERFWPLSRKDHPKQLLRLADPHKTLIEQTVDRVQPMVGQENVWVATAPHLVGPIGQSLQGTIPNQRLLAEPHKRNTAGCMVWLAANLLAGDPQAEENLSMAVVAADHRIVPAEGFLRTMDAALKVAEETGGLVTMGIRPDRPETGYGYIETAHDPKAILDGVRVLPVTSFREKPAREQAQEYVASGRFLWNSGSFFWTLRGFLNELSHAAPELHAATHTIAQSLREGKTEQAVQQFEALPNISIDYALMEKAKQVYVAEAAFDWDDVGAWDALDRSLPSDEHGNVAQGEPVLVDTRDCIIVSEAPGVVTTVLGMDGVAVIVTPDAVLVMPKGRAQEVKRVVEELKARGIDRT